MALWQIPIEFIPLKWAEENNFKVDSFYYGEDSYDTAFTWVNNQPTQDIDTIFSLILPRAESWGENLSIWGDDKVHDIQVLRKKGEITSIIFRLDLREKFSNMISSLCEAASLLDCVLLIPEQEVMVRPKVFLYKQKEYILKSNAARFLSDPVFFLTGTRKQ